MKTIGTQSVDTELGTLNLQRKIPPNNDWKDCCRGSLSFSKLTDEADLRPKYGHVFVP